MIDIAKHLLGIDLEDTSKDTLLEVYASGVLAYVEIMLGAEAAALVPNVLLAKMIVEDYRKNGSEHLTSYNYAGVSEDFTKGYSSDIMTQLKAYKNRVVGITFL